MRFTIAVYRNYRVGASLYRTVDNYIGLLPIPRDFRSVRTTLPTRETNYANRCTNCFFFQRAVGRLTRPSDVRPYQREGFKVRRVNTVPISARYSKRFFDLLARRLRLLQGVRCDCFRHIIVTCTLNYPSANVASRVRWDLKVANRGGHRDFIGQTVQMVVVRARPTLLCL